MKESFLFSLIIWVMYNDELRKDLYYLSLKRGWVLFMILFRFEKDLYYLGLVRRGVS